MRIAIHCQDHHDQDKENGIRGSSDRRQDEVQSFIRFLNKHEKF